MRHFLTTLLTFHWAVVFAVLAAACVPGHAEAPGLFGHSLAWLEPMHGGSSAALLHCLAFAFVAAMFAWAMLSTLFGGDGSGPDEVARAAFGFATWVLTMVLVVGALRGSPGLPTAVAVHLAALLASYLAVQADRQRARAPGAAALPASSAELRAAGAAHDSMLSRISGRGLAGEDHR